MPGAAVLGRARHAHAGRCPFAGMCAGMDLKTLYRLHWGARGSGARVRRADARRLRAAPAAAAARRRAQGLAAADAPSTATSRARAEGQDLVIFDPGAFAPGSLDAARQDRGGRALHVPAPGRARGAVPVGLLPAAPSRHASTWSRSRWSRWAPAPTSWARRSNARGEYARGAVRARARRVARPRGWRSGITSSIRARAGARRRARQALLVRLQRVPGPGRPGQAVRAARRPRRAIGVTLTSAYQLVPEASTSAIVVHHPQAAYYLVRE